MAEPSDEGEPVRAGGEENAGAAQPAVGQRSELVLTGSAAKAAWRRVRWPYYGLPVASLAVIVLIWNFAHPSVAQTTLIALGIAALSRAAFIVFSGGFSAVGYSVARENGRTTRRFTGKESFSGSAAAYAIVGALLVISGTNTRVGNLLAPVPEAALRAKDAVTSSLTKPEAVLAMVLLIFFGLVAMAAFIAQVVGLFPKYRDPKDPSSIGIAVGYLVFVAFIGFGFYGLLQYF